MKRIMLVLALLVLLAFTGSVCATDEHVGGPGTTTITGHVDACSIGITVPVDTSITITRGSDNVQWIGNVNVINNCNTPWTVNVVADNEKMYFSTNGGNAITYTYLTTVMSVGTSSDGPWTNFAAASSIGTAFGPHVTNPIVLDTGSGADTIPVYVKQPVTSADVGGDYKIKFTFNLIQGIPVV
jgi:hypothetical protein